MNGNIGRAKGRELIHGTPGFSPQMPNRAFHARGDRDLASDPWGLANGPGDPGGSDALDYSAFFRELWRRKWLFIAIAVLATGLATVIIVRLPAHYAAHALVVIGEPSATNLSSQDNTALAVPPDSGAVQTAVEVLRSPQLAATVIRRLNLEENREFNPAVAKRDETAVMAQITNMISRIKEWALGPQPLADTDAALSQTVQGFLDHLHVSIKDNSRMIDVAFDSVDARLAMLVANTLVDDYFNTQLESRAQSAQRISDWLRDRIGQLQAKVETAESAVEKYRLENGLFSVPGGSPLALKQMADVSAELATAQTARAAAEASLRQHRAALGAVGKNGTIGDSFDSPLMRTLHADEAYAEQQLGQMSVMYTDGHPGIAGLKERLSQIHAAMRRESLRVVASLENDLRIARLKEQDLNERLNRLKSDVSEMNGADIKLRTLERNAQADRLLLDDFVARLKTTSQTADTSSLRPDVQVASYAQLPVSPDRPKKGLLILVAGIASLIGAVLVVHLVEKSDRSLHSLEEVERLLKVAGLGMLPISNAARLSAPEAARYGSAYREALKAAYMNLFRARDEMPQVIAITSAMPGEGKTTLALSLAAMAAQSGQRVMLLDADFWKKGASVALGFRGGVGLAEVLEDKIELADAIVSDVVSGTDVILPGRFSRGSLLTWIGEFRELLDSLRNQYDVVIIDAPPVLSASESALLATHADATVMAVRWGSTPRDAAAVALRKLYDAGALLAGSVITMVNERQQAKYGYTEATYFASGFETYQSSPTDAITRSSMTEDSGERTPDEGRSNMCAALLVVDMQKNFGPSSGWHSLPKAARDLLVETINGVSNLAAGSGMAVLYAPEDHSTATPLSHLWTKGMGGDHAAIIRPNTSTRAPDAFLNSQLNSFLREKGIDHLFIVGMDGATSIKRTARSALDLGYRVTFIQDGIFTTSQSGWNRLLKLFESAGVFAITKEEFADFCQRLRKGVAA